MTAWKPVAGIAGAMAAVLLAFGQPLWCACGSAVPWSCGTI